MSNNPSQDRYNPPATSKVDFEKFRFIDLGVNELFWLSDSPGTTNVVHRKINENQGQQLQSREVVDFKSKLEVFQKN